MSESLYTRVIIWVNTILIPYWYFTGVTIVLPVWLVLQCTVLILPIDTMHSHIYWSVIASNEALCELRMVAM